MLFHGGQNAQIALDAASVVVSDVMFNHLSKCLLAGKLPAVISLTLQDTPEPLHRIVVDAVSCPGHALRHPSLLGFAVKDSAGILEPYVTMEEGMGVGVGLRGSIESPVDKRVSLRSLST